MLDLDLFLDSCVVLADAYGPEIDQSAPDCSAIIDCPAPKYTSSLVESELARVESRRKKLYQDLLAWMAGGGLIGSFPRANTPVNDDEHLKSLERAVRKLGPKETLDYIRLLSFRLEQGIREAIKKLKTPPLDLATDKELEGRMIAKNIHQIDARITAQYFAWGRGRPISWFITKDRKGVLSRRDDILADVEVVYSLLKMNVDLITPREARRRLGI
ncbi:MAG: hypothetical protein NT137_01345 [Methanomassiliicoccales archaeon]|nr:hypothetical protein [Methanomassiliicoccales archaeon]